MIATLHDAPEIRDFMIEIFGPRDGVLEKVREWLADPAVGTRIVRNPEIIAVSIVRISAREKYEKFGEETVRRLAETRLGVFQTLAVHPLHRQKGLGEKLSREQLQWMLEQDCAGATGVCWDHGQPDSSEHLFRKAGFEKIGYSKDFYRQKNQRCSRCEQECTCGATLYFKNGLLRFSAPI